MIKLKSDMVIIQESREMTLGEIIIYAERKVQYNEKIIPRREEAFELLKEYNKSET